MKNVLHSLEIDKLMDGYALPMDVEDVVSLGRKVERAVLAKVSQQEPIYMWRLEDDGWMECTKEWFDADISSGYEKRIVYAAPPQAAGIPEYYQEEWKRNVMLMWACVRKYDSNIPSDVLDFMREFLLSAAPKQESKL